MLEVGTKAPDFTLPDQNGKMHSLAEYKGQKIVLYFYPKVYDIYSFIKVRINFLDLLLKKQ